MRIRSSAAIQPTSALNKFVRVRPSTFMYKYYNRVVLLLIYNQFHLYLHQTNDLMLNAVGKDWINTGRCDFTVIQEPFMHHMTSAFLSQKNSPYTKEIILE